MAKADKARRLLEKIFPPMLATSVETLPAGVAEWILEPKFDGYRGLAGISAGEVSLLSRNRLDLSERFSGIVAALGKLGLDDTVLDGEIAAFDENRIARFEMTQHSSDSAVFVVFDILHHDGRDLRNLPIEERRAVLEKVFRRKRNPTVSVVSRYEAGLDDALADAKEAGHEGLIAKRPGSRYEPRRSRAWLKIKFVGNQELIVVGYTLLKDRTDAIGALLLAVREGRSLRYAGRVGTGFSTRQRHELFDLLESIEVPKPPLPLGKTRIKGAMWVEPRLIAQVKFSEWTHEGQLRHPSFVAMRDDKEVADVVREKTTSAAPEVRFTNPGRVLYPRQGYTKRDLAEYYAAVAHALVPALEGRPLALEHWNDGIDEEPWFEQSVRDNIPGWLTVVETPTRTRRGTARHLVVDRPETLLYLAQHSVLTIHTWASRAGSLESPDWMIFDLDPAKTKGFPQAIEAALVFRALFDTIGLPSFPKTSGKNGLHILVPLQPGYDFDRVTSFACRVSETVAAEVPGITVERTVAKRRGRLYADCLQNGYGKTIVAPYSPRGIDGAPVSAPLEWKEVKPGLDPAAFTIKTMPKRLEKKGDLFAPALREGVAIPTPS